jgi:large subunit ribosomal protein L19
MNKVELVENQQLRTDIPQFKAGDALKVHVRIKEDEKERVQIFEGIVLGVKGSGVKKSFRIRKISYGVGVERTFPVHSPNIKKIELLKKSKTKRAKYYYLRNRASKKFKVEEERSR